MNEQEIQSKLDELAEYQAQRDVLALEKQRLLKDAMPEEVRQRLEEIEAEFSGKFESVDSNIAGLQDIIKSEVAKVGASVKATVLHAVWSKGRVTWDTKSLDGYATAHPEINVYRKEGEPSVSIRAAK